MTRCILFWIYGCLECFLFGMDCLPLYYSWKEIQLEWNFWLFFHQIHGTECNRLSRSVGLLASSYPWMFGILAIECTHCKFLWTRAMIRCLKCKNVPCVSSSDYTADVQHQTVPSLACWRHGFLAFPLCTTSRLLFLVVMRKDTHTHTHYTITHDVSHYCLLQTIRVTGDLLQRLWLSHDLSVIPHLSLFSSTPASPHTPRLHWSCFVLLRSL